MKNKSIITEDLRTPQITAGNYTSGWSVFPFVNKETKKIGIEIDPGLFRKKIRYESDQIKLIKHIEQKDIAQGSSTGSAIGRGIAGALIAGPFGALVGASTAKQRTAKSSDIIGIEFVDGKKILIDVPKGTFIGNNFMKLIQDRIDFGFGSTSTDTPKQPKIINPPKKTELPDISKLTNAQKIELLKQLDALDSQEAQ